MFWGRSSATQSEQRARKELRSVFSESASGDLFTLDDLSDRVHNVRREAVAFILGELAREREIDQFATVISPASKGGIQRYEDTKDIPSSIFDPFQMREIEVEPELIRVYFTKHSQDAPLNKGAEDAGTSTR